MKKAQGSLILFFFVLIVIFIVAIILIPFSSDITGELTPALTDPTQAFVYKILFPVIAMIVIFLFIKSIRQGAG